jgi:hypothetical protein
MIGGEMGRTPPMWMQVKSPMVELMTIINKALPRDILD